MHNAVDHHGDAKQELAASSGLASQKPNSLLLDYISQDLHAEMESVRRPICSAGKSCSRANCHGTDCLSACTRLLSQEKMKIGIPNSETTITSDDEEVKEMSKKRVCST